MSWFVICLALFFTLLNDLRQRYYNPLLGRHVYGGVSVAF